LSTCPWCRKTKQFLDQKGVPYEGLDVDLLEGNEKEEAVGEVQKLAGEVVFPVLTINGKVIVGYKPEEMTKALKP
jgi:glutaredoxin